MKEEENSDGFDVEKEKKLKRFIVIVLVSFVILDRGRLCGFKEGERVQH